MDSAFAIQPIGTFRVLYAPHHSLHTCSRNPGLVLYVDRYIILTTIFPYMVSFDHPVHQIDYIHNSYTTASTQMSRPRPELQSESPTGHGLDCSNGGNVVERWRGWISDLPINNYPVHHGGQDLGPQNILHRDLHDVLGEDDKVPTLPWFDRAENVLGEGGISGVDGNSSKGFQSRHPLFREPPRTSMG
jgi:hypothetical protein